MSDIEKRDRAFQGLLGMQFCNSVILCFCVSDGPSELPSNYI